MFAVRQHIHGHYEINVDDGGPMRSHEKGRIETALLPYWTDGKR